MELMGLLSNALVPSKCLDGTTITELSTENFNNFPRSSESKNGTSKGSTMECVNSLSTKYPSASFTASFTLVSCSS